MDTISDITKQYFRTDLPALQIGDKVEITTKNLNKTEKKTKMGKIYAKNNVFSFKIANASPQ